MKYLVIKTDFGKYAIPENAIVSIFRANNGTWIVETTRRDYTIDERPEFISEGTALNSLDD